MSNDVWEQESEILFHHTEIPVALFFDGNTGHWLVDYMLDERRFKAPESFDVENPPFDWAESKLESRVW